MVTMEIDAYGGIAIIFWSFLLNKLEFSGGPYEPERPVVIVAPLGLTGSVTRKCNVIKCRGGHWPSGRICFEFAGRIGESATSYCRASNARPYVPIVRLFDKLEFT